MSVPGQVVDKTSFFSVTKVKSKKRKKESRIFESSMTPVASSSSNCDDSRDKLRAKIEELQGIKQFFSFSTVPVNPLPEKKF